MKQIRTLIGLLSGTLFLLLSGCESPSVPATKPVPAPIETKPEPKPAVVKAKPEKINPSRIYQLSDLQSGTIKVDGKDLKVTVMDTDGKRQEGMMFLTAAEANPKEGMLFAFGSDQAAGRGFWMHNTLIPLDILYINATGKVVHLVHGKPKDDTNLPSPVPYRNVLELVGGQAAKRGLKKGSEVSIPAQLIANAE